MNGARALIRTLLVGAVALPAACTKTQTSRTEKLQHHALRQPVSERVSNLRTSVDSLQQTVSRMPANQPEQNQRLATAALVNIAGALASIEGPRPPGGFRQQLQIIQSSSAELQGNNPNLAPEPTVDSALRAVHNALTSLRDARFTGNAQIAQLVSQVGGQLPQLDATNGPLHWVVVSHVLHSVSQSLAAMANVVEQRATPASTTTPVASRS
jgi:hypothetical protein